MPQPHGIDHGETLPAAAQSRWVTTRSGIEKILQVRTGLSNTVKLDEAGHEYAPPTGLSASLSHDVHLGLLSSGYDYTLRRPTLPARRNATGSDPNSPRLEIIDVIRNDNYSYRPLL